MAPVTSLQAATGSLKGVKVVDFTHVIAGPLAAQILGDLGAEVTKIENIHTGDIGRDMAPINNGQSHYFVAFNRNKRSIALDLKSEEGKAIAMALVKNADVVMENFAPGAMDRLGLGHEVIRQINPSVIYCSISGFGQTGPLAHKRSLDLIAQSYSGIMSTNGTPDSPPVKIGVPVGDTASSLFSAIGILAALYRRQISGEGEYLDVAMYDCLLTLLANYGGYFHATGEQPARAGSGHYFTVPYGTFEAADGEIAITVMSDSNWLRLCQTLELEELQADPELRTLQGRDTHRDRIYKELGSALSRYTVAELVGRLDEADVPCAPVNNIGQALKHPHTSARQMVLSLDHPDYGQINATSLPLRSVMREQHRPPPLLGEHTYEILLELGMSKVQIEQVLAAGSAVTPTVRHDKQKEHQS